MLFIMYHNIAILLCYFASFCHSFHLRFSAGVTHSEILCLPVAYLRYFALLEIILK